MFIYRSIFIFVTCISLNVFTWYPPVVVNYLIDTYFLSYPVPTLCNRTLLSNSTCHPGHRLNIKMLSYQYRYPQVKDMTVSRPSWGWVGLWGFLWWAPSAKRKDHLGVSSGWSSVWHRSNTGLSSAQYEQIPIILGVWTFWLTPFIFSVNNILAGLWLNCISSVEITLFLLADILLQHRALFQC